jgi:hypothetical protein
MINTTTRLPGRRAGGTTRGGEKKNAWGGGRRKSLKTLDPDKGIQGNQSLFLGWIWLGLGWIWLDLAKFGLGLE